MKGPDVELINNPRGSYRFLTGIAPYSSGVVASPGYEIVRATPRGLLPYRLGFELIEQHLQDVGRTRQALCAIELRSPVPFTFQGFAEFNEDYRRLLAEWDLLVEAHNPIARTNVAPAIQPPEEPSLHAFSYTMPSETPEGGTTFVVAGAGELREGRLTSKDIVRKNETSEEAMKQKAAHVMRTMSARLRGLGASWEEVTAVDVYTVHPLEPLLVRHLLGPSGPAARHGVTWHYSRPPIIGIDFEMDVRGIRREVVL